MVHPNTGNTLGKSLRGRLSVHKKHLKKKRETALSRTGKIKKNITSSNMCSSEIYACEFLKFEVYNNNNNKKRNQCSDFNSFAE